MKNSKKLAVIMLALVMALSMSLTAFASAAPSTYELFVQNDAPNHTYDAYQIFSGDLSSDGTTLSNVQWGLSVADAEALIAALTTDTKPIILANNQTTTLKDVFIQLTSETNAALPIEKKAAVIANILGFVSNDSTTLDRFAELVGEVVYAEGEYDSHKYLGAPVSTGDEQSTENGVKGYKISGLPAGYYLIKDRDDTVTDNGNTGDFYTKYIIRVVKSDTLRVKGEGVTVEKSVNDTLGGTFTEHEDAFMNETLYFKWQGTLPNNLASYDTYNYKFIDTMSTGLEFVRYEQIYTENQNGSVGRYILNLDDESTANDSLPEGVIATEPVLEDGKWVFTLEFEDLFKLFPNLLSGQKIIVKYSCVLTKDAVVNGSNPNEVKLEYDNNPNGEGTGTTITDVAHAFTFKVDIDKYDAANPKTKLEGVEFILYYRDTVQIEGGNTQVEIHYAQVITEEMVAAGETLNGKSLTSDDVGKVYGFTKNREEASVLDTDANGAIYLKGLDQGTYYLEETKTNDGYNLLDTPVQIEIVPTYDVSGNECSVTVSYEVDGMEQGASSTVGVRNSKGSTLPSTGGIGTTIFYIVGAVLVLGACIVLITRRRMAVEN